MEEIRARIDSFIDEALDHLNIGRDMFDEAFQQACVNVDQDEHLTQVRFDCLL